MSVLDKYKVSFTKRIFFNREFKSLYTNDDMLTAYISDFNTVSKVNQLLDLLNITINNPADNSEMPTLSGYIAVVNSVETKIYEDPNDYYDNPKGSYDFIIPTQEFKVIIQAWKDYLVH